MKGGWTEVVKVDEALRFCLMEKGMGDGDVGKG